MSARPLFIPLRTKYFRAFEAGTKTVEYRAYGPRWNERTCYAGRAAIISHGYSGRGRLSAVVASFEKLDSEPGDQMYPPGTPIAAIHFINVKEIL